MDFLKRVAAALDGELASGAVGEKQPPKATPVHIKAAPLEQKRLHVLLVLLRKHASTLKKQTGRELTLKTLERIIHLLRENLHYFEKLRLQMIKDNFNKNKTTQR